MALRHEFQESYDLLKYHENKQGDVRDLLISYTYLALDDGKESAFPSWFNVLESIMPSDLHNTGASQH